VVPIEIVDAVALRAASTIADDMRPRVATDRIHFFIDGPSTTQLVVRATKVSAARVFFRTAILCRFSRDSRI